jgi:hypothetical protein
MAGPIHGPTSCGAKTRRENTFSVTGCKRRLSGDGGTMIRSSKFEGCWLAHDGRHPQAQ